MMLAAASAVALSSACDPSGPPIERLSSYENWRHTEEHQYGFGVELWKQGETQFGLLRVAEGHLAGGIPIGAIEDVAFNPATGQFSFRSKLSLGMVSANDYSRDLYSFSGTIGNGQIEGTIERRDGSGRSFGSREVTLSRDTAADSARGPDSCAEWIKLWEPVFQAWGPKW